MALTLLEKLNRGGGIGPDEFSLRRSSGIYLSDDWLKANGNPERMKIEYDPDRAMVKLSKTDDQLNGFKVNRSGSATGGQLGGGRLAKLMPIGRYKSKDVPNEFYHHVEN